MRLHSIETTPSPNCMKLNLDASVGTGSFTLNAAGDTPATAKAAPEIFQHVLSIAGVASLYATGDFITLTRKGSADWQPILAAAGNLLGIAPSADASLASQLQANATGQKTAQTALSTQAAPQNFGQVDVAIQMFRGIPVQVRATDDSEQARVALPDRFNQALQRAIVATEADYVADRIRLAKLRLIGRPNAFS
ncbi:MAG: virulence factor, partial [Cyanobacteria bacterium J06598_3]